MKTASPATEDFPRLNAFFRRHPHLFRLMRLTVDVYVWAMGVAFFVVLALILLEGLA